MDEQSEGKNMYDSGSEAGRENTMDTNLPSDISFIAEMMKK